MKHTTAPLRPDVYYHIYNRGNNRENLFLEERNYPYFLNLYAKHIEPIADTYAYCLMKNRFHLSIRIKTEEEYMEFLRASETCENPHKKYDPSQRFSNFFNAYAKAINKGYSRTGSLFEERFGRIPVMNSSYFENLIFYIHFNPQRHGFVSNFRDWCWSSYPALVGNGPTKLKRAEVLSMFGDVKRFEEFHRERVDEKKLVDLIDPEFDLETDFTGL